MTNTPAARGSLWGRFRFAVVGALLSSPPPRGERGEPDHCLWPAHPPEGRGAACLGFRTPSEVFFGKPLPAIAFEI